MKQWKKLMRYLINTISTRKIINQGFSLMEIIIAISLATLLITSIVGGAYYLYHGLAKAETDSIEINEIAEFFQKISGDILSPDIHPHRPPEDYELESEYISFYANNNQVEYEFSDNIFTITYYISELKDLSSDMADNSDDIVTETDLESEFVINTDFDSDNEEDPDQLLDDMDGNDLTDSTDDESFVNIIPETKEYQFIKNFEIEYYDKDDFIIYPEDEEEFPFYCKFYFTLKDNNKIEMVMRL